MDAAVDGGNTAAVAAVVAVAAAVAAVGCICDFVGS